MPFSVQ